MKTYNIAYSCSDLYSKLAGVSILSLLKNNPEANFNIWILSDSISILNKQKLRNTAIKNHKSVQLDFIDIEECLQVLKEKKLCYNGGVTPFAKFFLADLLPAKTERALYIDCDTLVVNTIDDLYDFSMEDGTIAISPDCIHRKYNKYIGFPETKPLCATGVVLFDLKKWKTRNCFNRLMNQLNNSDKHYPLVDLDLINIVLEKEIIYYPIKNQIITQFLIYSYNAMPFIFGYKENPFSSEEYSQIATEPVIYHFCGNTLIRPWYKNSKHPIKKIYDKYYYTSEWQEIPQTDYILSLPYKFQWFLWKYCPKFFFYFFSMIMQRIFIRLEYKL